MSFTKKFLKGTKFYFYFSTLMIILYLTVHNIIIFHYRFDHASYRSSIQIEATSSNQVTQQTQGYLRYSVCNGFTNQRLGIVFGLIMAKELKRSLVLPRVFMDGVQTKADNVAADEINTKPLSEWHDVEIFTQFLKQNQIQYEMEGLRKEVYTVGSCIRLAPGRCMDHLHQTYSSVERLYFECPFPAVSIASEDVKRNQRLFIEVLQNLKPNTKFQELINKGLQRLQYLSGKEVYNFLHVRMELDWIAHCERWQAIKDGSVRDNCFTDTFSLGTHLQSKGVEIDVPLYVATDWNLTSVRIKEAVLDSLREAGYEIVTHTSILSDLIIDLKREELGLVDYYLALQSNKFIGNSVSTFSAMVILERRSLGLWSGYYNGGSIPLSRMVPLYALPWVFAYNSWSTSLDYLTIGAVRSAQQVARLKPYCLFTGDQNSSIYKWLKHEGVEMIVHRPEWIIQLAELNTKSRNYSKTHSHLYANTEGIVGTFQRIDIPVLDQLKQYDFVLYTDTDVFFRGQISLNRFPQPLPKAVGMGPEMVDAFPYNAGIALWNIHAIRKQHKTLVEFILTSGDALYWKGYGPVDQGALNQFFEKEIKSWKLPFKFNHKPYKKYLDDALIVHFHGPKPHHYLEYLQNGTCGNFSFGNMCELAVRNGACFYIVEDWFTHVRDQEIAKKIYTECKNIIENELNRRKELENREIIDK